MRISARKGTKITENVLELKLTKPQKVILKLVTTYVAQHFNFFKHIILYFFTTHSAVENSREMRFAL